MRPMEADGEHWLSYYLMKEDEEATRYKQSRLESGIDARAPEEEVCILPTFTMRAAFTERDDIPRQ